MFQNRRLPGLMALPHIPLLARVGQVMRVDGGNGLLRHWRRRRRSGFTSAGRCLYVTGLEHWRRFLLEEGGWRLDRDAEGVEGERNGEWVSTSSAD